MGAEQYEHDTPSSGIRGNPPRSGWSRVRHSFDRFVESLLDIVREPSLSDRLPPREGAEREKQAEFLLLGILRAPHAYQLAAIDVARYAIALRRLGDDAYAEGLVHFVLSRMKPDADGTIAMTRLRDILCDIPFAGKLVPALRRLEEHGIVSLTWMTTTPDRVKLRIPL